MIEEIRDKLVELTGGLREALSVLTSDIPRLAGIFVIIAIVLITVIASTFTPEIFAQTKNPYATTQLCQAGSYWVFPIFTNGFNLALGEAQLQCSALTINIPVIIGYYFQLGLILFIALIVGIMVLGLGG